MSEQSERDQRYSLPAQGATPGEDDGLVAPDEAMAPLGNAAGSAQQLDPGGYPHEPSDDVPSVPTDPGERPERDLPQPEVPAGAGEDNAQVQDARTPDDESSA
jgi:hypothetical protein